MASDSVHGAVLEHPSGCLIALAASPPFPSGDGQSLANDLIDSYLTDGENFIGDRPGQFSFAIWDPTSEQLHLYRDRIGVPPLFYWSTDRSLAWATSIKTLLDLGAEREVDNLALGHYQLTGYIQSPRTMVSSIRKVPAAHRFTVSRGETSIHRYWAPSWEPKRVSSSSEQSQEVENLMVQAIERSVPSSRRIGLLLSGGVDSTGVAVASSRIHDLEVETFTFTYRNSDNRFNESQAARAVAEHLGFGHHEIEISPEYLETNLARLLGIYEEPIGYGFHSARMGPIREYDVDVVLTGAEGATWGAGKAWRVGMRLAHLLPGGLLTRARNMAFRSTTVSSDIQTLLDFAASSGPQRYLKISQQRVLEIKHAASLRAHPELTFDAEADMIDLLSSITHGDRRRSADDERAFLALSSFGPEHLTWWSYRWSDSVGLSVRFPLLDFDYIDYMAKKRRGDGSKLDRRRMAARHLPQSLANGTPNAQAAPLAEWLRGPLKDWVGSILTKQNIEAEGTFVWNSVERCLREHRSGAADHKWCLWTTANYLLWKGVVLGR